MSEIDYTVMPLFSTPIYIKEYVPISDEEKNTLKSLDYERMETDNGYFSKDKYVLENPELINLKEHILDCVNEFTFGELKIAKTVEFYITNSWTTKHKKFDWAQPHAHTNSLLSGVFYFQVDEKSGKLWFQKESNHHTIFPMHIDLDVTEYNILNSKGWAFTPKNNQLYLFPPWLKHNVNNNESDELRYSLAFNIYLKGKIGKNEYQLEIK